MKAKKSLGQHFLTSEGAVHHMVTAGGTTKGDAVLEIGPGKGVLTKALLNTGARVIAVEKDDRMIAVINENFSKEIESKQLTLVNADILKINIEDILRTSVRSSDLDADRDTSADCDQDVLTGTVQEQTQGSNKGMCQICRPYSVIANIPYYITGEIMRLFLESNTQPKSMTILVQKEVAERIVARDKKESILSLSVKLFGTPSLVSVVKRGSFFPIPNVDSAIIHIADISHTHISGFTIPQFFTAIKAGFAHKRKKLISNLESVYEKSALAHAFSVLSLDTNVRPEDIPLLEWKKLISELSS